MEANERFDEEKLMKEIRRIDNELRTAEPSVKHELTVRKAKLLSTIDREIIRLTALKSAAATSPSAQLMLEL